MKEEKKPWVIFYNPKTTDLVPSEYVEEGQAFMVKRDDLEIKPTEFKFDHEESRKEHDREI